MPLTSCRNWDRQSILKIVSNYTRIVPFIDSVSLLKSVKRKSATVDFQSMTLIQTSNLIQLTPPTETTVIRTPSYWGLSSGYCRAIHSIVASSSLTVGRPKKKRNHLPQTHHLFHKQFFPPLFLLPPEKKNRTWWYPSLGAVNRKDLLLLDLRRHNSRNDTAIGYTAQQSAQQCRGQHHISVGC